MVMASLEGRALVCPACRGRLEARAEGSIECAGCGRSYPVREGIPILLVAEARERRRQRK